MSYHEKLTPRQLGTVEAVLLGFNRHQLPRLLRIKAKVDDGGLLDKFDITFLEETLDEIRASEHFADQHEEFRLLVAEVAGLYDHIWKQAKANEQSD